MGRILVAKVQVMEEKYPANEKIAMGDSVTDSKYLLGNTNGIYSPSVT